MDAIVDPEVFEYAEEAKQLAASQILCQKVTGSRLAQGHTG